MIRSHRGFTLVELIASLTISVLLITTVMGLTARLSQSAKTVREAHPIENWQQVLISRLRQDYQNARSIIIRPHEIIIDGKATPNSSPTDEDFHLQVPMRIVYSIQSNQDNSWLVRSQQTLIAAPSESRTFEMMADGMIGFTSDQVLATDVAPGVLKLGVEFMDAKKKPLEVVLVRHGALE